MASNLIALPPEIIARCWKYGEQVVTDYASGWNANSRAVTCFDAHANVELQALARMAECAFCLWAEQSLEKLKWDRWCDDGADIIIPEAGRIDVKHTRFGRYLIWPIAKNQIFASKRFDVLVLVVGTPFDDFRIVGWITKADFAQKHKVAKEGEKLFPGTWYLDRSELQPMEKLCPYDSGWDEMWAKPFYQTAE